MKDSAPEYLQQQLQQTENQIARLEEDIVRLQQALTAKTNEKQIIGQQLSALAQSRNKYRKLFNYANDAMFVISLDPSSPNYIKFSDVNNVACKRLGYTRQELLQMTPFDISDSKEKSSNQNLFRKLKSEGGTTFETVYTRKDGTRFPVEISALRLTIDGKDLYMAIARDISERKASEKTLEQSQKLYRLLAENVHDVIWTTDNNIRVNYVSPSFSQLTGYHLRQAGKTIENSLFPSSPLSQGRSSMFTLSEDRPYHWESKIMTRSGKTIWVESIASPLPLSANELPGVVGVTRDISSRKKIILELEEAREQAYAASRAKSKFLANMSHEVRTPMNGVLGMLQLLKLTPLNDEQLEFINTAMVSGESLLTIINDILDYSKVEAGKLQITPNPFDLRETVKLLITSFTTLVDDQKVTLEYEISPEIPETIIADQVRIRQILFNLIGNAVKFTEAGKISLSIVVGKRINDSDLILTTTLEDTGIGIAPDLQKDLFKPFTQVDSPKQWKYKGTGLGLSIVKTLVTGMGGDVHLERNTMQGTTVRFTMQVNSSSIPVSQNKEERPAPILTSPSRRLKTLIVEDEKINQQILQAILKKLGHITSTAENGHQALKYLKANRYDILLMDVQMPDLDGIQTTRIIRTSEEYKDFRNIPIVALTAYAMTGDKEKCLAAGMSGYISKPVDIKKLERLLKNLTT